jgi:hypothetical protein
MSDTRNASGTRFKNAIGEDGTVRAFAWTTAKGKQNSTKALISAHGMSALINGNFPSGNYKIVYYCAHGCNLDDPGLRAFVDGRVWPREEFTSATSIQDYGLTKYQENIEGGTETYADIMALPTKFQMDVITIRDHHSGIFIPTLDPLKFSDLIRLLQKNGYHYEEFHCSFCRGTAWTWISKNILGEKTSQGSTFMENKVP